MKKSELSAYEVEEMTKQETIRINGGISREGYEVCLYFWDKLMDIWMGTESGKSVERALESAARIVASAGKKAWNAYVETYSNLIRKKGISEDMAPWNVLGK